MPNPILDSRVFCRIAGALMILFAVAGAVFMGLRDGRVDDRWLTFDWTHVAASAVLGVAALVLGFWRDGEFSPWYARIAGAFLVLLGAAGYVAPARDGLEDALSLRLHLGENLIHLFLGAWGVVVGFFGPKPEIDRLVIPDLE